MVNSSRTQFINTEKREKDLHVRILMQQQCILISFHIIELSEDEALLLKEFGI